VGASLLAKGPAKTIHNQDLQPMNTTESLKDYQRVRSLAIRSLFEIIEQSSEGTVIVDRDANIVWMNERYARRFGLESAAGAIGKPCESVIPGSLLREVVRTGGRFFWTCRTPPKSRWW
jgi:transcriptional regulator with PAS, ATPase and Fis domain